MNVTHHDDEGVVKFELNFREAPPPPAAWIHEIEAWRRVFYRLELIGQNPARYGGLGFGNISRRIKHADYERDAFVVTGTQTGNAPVLTGNRYAIVRRAYPAQNRIEAEGLVHPSSEAMTHAMIYQLMSAVDVVIHVHSPELWRAAKALGYPITAASAAYGTPEMASEVRRLFDRHEFARAPLFSMGGHRDGLVAFGETAEAAGTALLAALARVFEEDQREHGDSLRDHEPV